MRFAYKSYLRTIILFTYIITQIQIIIKMIRGSKRTRRSRGVSRNVGLSGGRKRTARHKTRGGDNVPNDGTVEWFNRHYGTNYKS